MEQGMTGKLEGFNEILKVLNTLDNDKKVNVLLKKTNREAVKPVQKKLKSLSYPRRLISRASIRAATINGSRHPNAVAAGPLNTAYPLRWLEGGTAERYTKSGAYRGKIQGKGLIESMIDSESKSIIENIPQKYGEDLVRLTANEVKRINKKK